MLVAVAVSAFSLGACTSKTPPKQPATSVLPASPTATLPLPPLDAPADLGWVLSDGNRATLADFRGKILVLDFYATWCGPCRESIPHLIAIEQNYRSEGLQIVGLNVGGPDDRIKVADFAKEMRIPYPLGFPDQALSDFFLSDHQTIPQTFVFDRAGRLLRRFIGYDQSTGIELQNVILSQVVRH